MGFFDRIFHRGSTGKTTNRDPAPPEPNDKDAARRKESTEDPTVSAKSGAPKEATASAKPNAATPPDKANDKPNDKQNAAAKPAAKPSSPAAPPPSGKSGAKESAPAPSAKTSVKDAAPAALAKESAAAAAAKDAQLPAAVRPAGKDPGTGARPSLASDAAALRKPNGASSALATPEPAVAARTPAPAPQRTTTPIGVVREPSASTSSSALPAAKPRVEVRAPVARPATPAPAPANAKPATPAATPAPSSTPSPQVVAPTPAPPAPAAPAPAIAVAPAATSESPIADGSDMDLDSLIDAAIDGSRTDIEGRGHANGHSDGAKAGVMSAADAAAARETFEAVLGEHLFQLRGLALELRFGPASSRWLAPALAEVKSLRKMSEAMEMLDLVTALDGLGAALEDARRVADVSIEGQSRERLLKSCDQLTRAVPSAFKIDDEQMRREVVIVDELLRRVAGVDDWAIQRIHAAGLSRLEQFLQGRPEDLAAVSGLERELAGAVLASFLEYKRECPSMLAAIDRADEMRKLGVIVRDLEGLQQAFERVSQRWSDDDRAAKRKLQRQREANWGRARLVLARLGAVDRLARLEIRRFADRIEDLGEMLRSPGAPPATASAPRAQVG